MYSLNETIPALSVFRGMNGITIWRPIRNSTDTNRREHISRYTCTNRARSRRLDSGQTMAKQGQTSGQGLEGLTEGLTVAAREASNATPAGKGLPPVHLW